MLYLNTRSVLWSVVWCSGRSVCWRYIQRAIHYEWTASFGRANAVSVGVCVCVQVSIFDKGFDKVYIYTLLDVTCTAAISLPCGLSFFKSDQIQSWTVQLLLVTVLIAEHFVSSAVTTSLSSRRPGEGTTPTVVDILSQMSWR